MRPGQFVSLVSRAVAGAALALAIPAWAVSNTAAEVQAPLQLAAPEVLKVAPGTPARR